MRKYLSNQYRWELFHYRRRFDNVHLFVIHGEPLTISNICGHYMTIDRLKELVQRGDLDERFLTEAIAKIL